METSETKTKWGVDPAHSEIGFKVRHLMVAKVSGYFDEFDASIYTTGEDFMSAEIDFWINPASINTGDATRDTHLRSADFFDVENFKEINFTSDSYQDVDKDGSYELYGNLTIKGIAKKIKLDVEFGGVVKDQWGNHKAGFSIHGKINRKDWGLHWNETLDNGGMLLGDDILISCEVELVKQS
jgi:polyisoprenoid-binding protein YceI